MKYIPIEMMPWTWAAEADEYVVPQSLWSGMPIETEYICLHCGEVLRFKVSVQLVREEAPPATWGIAMAYKPERTYLRMEGTVQHLC